MEWAYARAILPLDTATARETARVPLTPVTKVTILCNHGYSLFGFALLRIYTFYGACSACLNI